MKYSYGTIKQLAEEMQLSRQTIYKKIERRDLRTVKKLHEILNRQKHREQEADKLMNEIN